MIFSLYVGMAVCAMVASFSFGWLCCYRDYKKLDEARQFELLRTNERIASCEAEIIKLHRKRDPQGRFVVK